jgi:hypothetical protein
MNINLDELLPTAGPIGGQPIAPFAPTAEQELIIEAACTTKDNILINALAGAAKTTTLELICKALPVQPILSLAFNKRIATEMTKRLPGHVACHTLNAIGHRVWMQSIPKRLVVETKKSYNILKGMVDGLPRAEKSEVYESFSATSSSSSARPSLQGISLMALAQANPSSPESEFGKRLTRTSQKSRADLVDRVLRESSPNPTGAH